MAQASSSKMTLDAVGLLLAASLGRSQAAASPHRQIDTLPPKSVETNEAEYDYDSDGFCTPPLPPEGDLSQATTYFSPGSFMSNGNQLSIPASTLESTKPTSSAHTLSNHTLHSIGIALPSKNEVSDAEGFLETVVVKLEVDEAAPIKTAKRRGRPPGSTKAKKIQRQMDQTEQAAAPSSRETLHGGVNRSSSPLGGAQETTREAEVTFETKEFSAQLQLDRFDSAQEDEEAQGEDVPNEEVLDEEAQIEEAQKEDSQEEEIRGEEQSTTPEQALLPDFIFEPPDDSMFAELRAFLDQEDADSTVSSSDEEEEGDGISQEVYERRRLKKLRANEAILSKLGLGQQPLGSPMPILDVEERENSAPLASPIRSYGRKTYKPPTRSIKVDADGTTTSLPLPGCTFEVAYVDMPVLRPRIRMRHVFHDDVPDLPPCTEPLSEEEGGEEEEPLPPPSPIKKVNKSAKKRPPVVLRRGVLGEALEGEGTTCHQCRRKTEDPKMRCRYHEGGRVCPLFYCGRCLKIRYDIDFDEDSRTFECPRCSAYCNCSLCIHRAGLHKVCGGDLGVKLLDGEGNRLYPSVRHYLDAKVGRPVKIGPGGLQGKAKTSTTTGTTMSKPAAVKGEPSTAKKQNKGKKEERKRKAVEEAASSESRKRKMPTRKQQFSAEEKIDNGEVESIAQSEEEEGLSGRSRKIKLTFKAKATAEEENLRRQRLKHGRVVKSVNPNRERKVQFAKSAVTSVRRGRPLAAAQKVIPQIIEAANVWVKSKADVAPSSSDSEPDEKTWRTMSADGDERDSEEEGEEQMGGDDAFGEKVAYQEYDSEMDDGAGQDNPGDEESSSVQGTGDSPLAGQVEFTHHPELTMTEYSSNASQSIFQANGLIPFVEDTHAFTPPTAPELTDFIQQLMGAGVI